jgi:hypothetical protein
MDKRIGVIVAVLLSAAACIPGDDAPLPELKGRWAAINAAKLRALVANAPANAPQPSLAELCGSEYVTFGKQAVRLHHGGTSNTLFWVREAKRKGARIVLTGKEAERSFAAVAETQVELVLREGELRFDDVVDPRGRSIRHDRFTAPRSVELGFNTIGDVYGLVYDLRACRA